MRITAKKISLLIKHSLVKKRKRKQDGLEILIYFRILGW